jgi:anti-anti-sigma factor
MENIVEAPEETGVVPPTNENRNINAGNSQLDHEKRINSNVMSIRLGTDGLVIKEETKFNEELEPGMGMLSGVYCEGVQYYDLSGISYINNTGMAILIDLLRSLLEMGVEVQFVNVHENIRKKIKLLGLDKIINIED